MKRTPLRRIGARGRANREANRRLSEMFADVPSCEMRLEGCLGAMYRTFAHRHKRAHYQGDVDKLSDYNQVVIACVECHNRTEYNRELNREVFTRLRGEE